MTTSAKETRARAGVTKAKFVERALHRSACVRVRGLVVVYLRGCASLSVRAHTPGGGGLTDENVLALQSARAEGAPGFRLVLVEPRGVDVPAGGIILENSKAQGGKGDNL